MSFDYVSNGNPSQQRPAIGSPSNPSLCLDVANSSLYASINGKWQNLASIAAWVNVKTFGAVGNGIADDTAAIQSALTSFSVGNNTKNRVLYFPAGSYNITNTLVYEGGDGTGLRIVGENAPPFLSPSADNFGSQLSWSGPAGGTMMLVLGANGMQVEQLGFQCNGVASNGLWLDATNAITAVSYNISSITRSGDIVTATIGSHTIASPLIVKVAGVTDSSFDGTFRALYNDSTSVSWIQGGANTTSSGGTCVKYQSMPTAFITLRNCAFYNPAATSTSVSSITGTFSTYTLTTPTPHYLNVGDYVIYTGGTNSSYDPNVWEVQAVTSSTTATLTTTGILTSGAPAWSVDDGNGTTGGTILSDACGLRIGHRFDASALSNIAVYDCSSYSSVGGGLSLCGFKCDKETTSNVKDFQFYNALVEGYQYGLAGFDSGSLSVFGYGGFLSTPQTSTILACVDFANCGGGGLHSTFISGAETESNNNRFWQGSGMVQIEGCTIETSAPTDDITLLGGGLLLTGSTFVNQRASTSVPRILCLGPLLSAHTLTYPTYVLAIGCGFSNANASGTGPTPGWLTVQDSQGNLWNPSGFYASQASNITSLSCWGTADYLSSTAVAALKNQFAPLNSISLGGATPTVPSGYVGLGTTTATSATAGSNGAVPGQVAGYLEINIGGTVYKLPYFAV